MFSIQPSQLILTSHLNVTGLQDHHGILLENIVETDKTSTNHWSLMTLLSANKGVSRTCSYLAIPTSGTVGVWVEMADCKNKVWCSNTMT